MNDHKVIKLANRRLFLILIGQFSLFGVIAYRLFSLQIVKHGEYLTLSANNQYRTIVEPISRGLILDGKNNILAENIIEYLLILDSRKVINLEDFLMKIKKVLSLKAAEEERIRNSFTKNKRFIELKSISFDDSISLKYSMNSFSELLINKKYLRVYPFHHLGVHIVGYVTNENKKYHNEHYMYTNNFKIGKTGIEEKYNSFLSGTNTITTLQIDSSGRKISEVSSIPGEEGRNIKTTIDIELQKMIYDTIGNENVAAVVVDIKKQSLMAMVSNPSFDPEILNSDELEKTEWSSILKNSARPLVNKCISGLYSPGSTFKVIVALAALELGIINSSTTVFCDGEYQIGNRTYRCLHNHGSVNIQTAIERSCNSFFYSIAKNIDIKFLEEVAISLGLGKISALNLVGEIKGLVPSKLWKLRKKGRLWYTGDSANYVIGQGYLSCTPLQLCITAASIASGKIVNLLVNSDDESISIPNQLIQEKNFQIVRDAMFGVVNRAGGTAYNSIGQQYKALKLCGKTGTVQISSNKDEKNHSIFIGFAPFNNPQYAVSVVGEFMGYGASFATPLAGKILDFCLNFS